MKKDKSDIVLRDGVQFHAYDRVALFPEERDY